MRRGLVGSVKARIAWQYSALLLIVLCLISNFPYLHNCETSKKKIKKFKQRLTHTNMTVASEKLYQNRGRKLIWPQAELLRAQKNTTANSDAQRKFFASSVQEYERNEVSISDRDNHLSALTPCSHSIYQSKNASSDFNSICKINITCKTANGRGCGPFEHIRLLTATFHLPSSNRVLHLGRQV